MSVKASVTIAAFFHSILPVCFLDFDKILLKCYDLEIAVSRSWSRTYINLRKGQDQGSIKTNCGIKQIKFFDRESLTNKWEIKH